MDDNKQTPIAQSEAYAALYSGYIGQPIKGEQTRALDFAVTKRENTSLVQKVSGSTSLQHAQKASQSLNNCARTL